MATLKLNLSRHKAAQDMIKLIEKEKELSTPDAIDYAVNSRAYKRIINTGLGPIALPVWGHGELKEREWFTLDNPSVKIELSEEKLQMIRKVVEVEKVSTETAVSYFLLFTMEALGYHI